MDPDAVGFAELMAVFISYMVDDMVSAEVPRAKARERLVELVSEQANVYRLVEFQRTGKGTWGSDQVSQVGLHNAQAIVGGPAAPVPQAG